MTDGREDEVRLIREARAGSRDAAATLFQRDFDYVWGTVYRLTGGQRAVADDVAQEAFVRAFRALDRFEEGRQFRRWVTRIALNSAIGLLRRERHLRLVDPGDFAEVGDHRETADPDEEVTAAVSRLDVPKRTVIVLHFWFGHTLEEIAEILAIPLGTVASRLSRGLADLRSDLEVDRADSA